MSNSRTGYKFALAPIHWLATADGWLDRNAGPERPELFRLVREAGFLAIKAEIPPSMTAEAFRALLDEAGLAPAPSYYVLRLPDQGTPTAQMLDLARQAAAQQAALGLDHMFLGCGMFKDAPRVRRPAVGAEADAGRLAQVIDQIGQAATVMRAEGATAALHPHIGTWVETEAETCAVLEAIDPALLRFGPDVGHLGWAGADLTGLARRYRQRIASLHIKDIRADVRKRALAAGWTYQETVLAGIWAEPGLGDLDLEGVLAALGPDFDGWLVGEVDRASLPPFESAQATARWLSARTRPLPEAVR